MCNTRGLAALLLALCVIFSSTFALYAAVDSGMDETTAQDETLSEERYPAAEVPETGLPQEVRPEGRGESDSVLLEEPQPGDRDPARAEGQALESSDYVFVISDPGEDNYREWETPSIRYGERVQYDLHLARYENGVYEIVSTKEEGMGAGLEALKNPAISIVWYEGYGYMLEIDGVSEGEHEIEAWCYPPGTMQRVDAFFRVNIVVEREYAFAVASPGLGNYNRWQDQTMEVGQVLQYDLYYMWFYDREGWYGHVSTPEEGMGIDLTCEAAPPFRLYWDEQGTHLEIIPTELGTYSLLLEYTLPDTGERAEFELKIEVIDHYIALVVDLGGQEYRERYEHTIELGERQEYDLHLARYDLATLTYEIVSTKEQDMGMGFGAFSTTADIAVTWREGYGHVLELEGVEVGSHTVEMWYDPPGSDQRVNVVFELQVVEHIWEYAFAVTSPGLDNYQRWQDRTMTVDQTLQYDLYFIWYKGDMVRLGSTLEEDMGIELTYQADPPFHLYWDERGYHLEIAPEQPGTYTMQLYYTRPDGGGAGFELSVKVVRHLVDDDKYVFVISDPGEENYREWEERTVEIGEQHQYDLHLARYENGVYEIVSTEERDMGAGWGVLQDSSDFLATWDEEEGHRIVINANWKGTHTTIIYYRPFGSTQRVEFELVLHVVKQRYDFMVSEPGTTDLRSWDDPTVRVGDAGRYALHLTRLENTTPYIDTEAEWGIVMQDSPHFTLEPEADGYYISMQPTLPGTYSIQLYFVQPATGVTTTQTFYLSVVEPNPDGEMFEITAPDGRVIFWNEGEHGSTTVYYAGQYDPEQTLKIRCRDEWQLTDEENSLRQVSSEPDGAVFAMVRPTWDSPCTFRSGDTVINVYIMLPTVVQTQFVLYDPVLADTYPERLTAVKDGTLVAGQENQVAIRMTVNGKATLISDPLQILHFDRQVTAYAEPGERYFTLIAQDGMLTLGIERGRSQTVLVGGRKQARMFIFKGPTFSYSISDGDNLKSTIEAYLTYDNNPFPGSHEMVRSSDPGVISVELPDQENGMFLLKPEGLGEARIYLESDEYFCEVLLAVREWDISMTAIQDTYPPWEPGDVQWGPVVLPPRDFNGTHEDPFIIPYRTFIEIEEPTSYVDLYSYLAEDCISSSDPEIVKIDFQNHFQAYIKPVGTGTCTITFRDGPFVKEVVVRAEPDALQQVGNVAPGFYTYYGSAHVRKDAVSLPDGLPILMAVAPQPNAGQREVLDSARFQLADPGVIRVELVGDNLFQIVPLEDGRTTLRYTTQTGEVFELQVSVSLPVLVWDFVVPDDTAEQGYRVWTGEQAAAGDEIQRELFFAQIVQAGDGSIHSIKLLDFPEDLCVAAQDHSTFDLVRQEASWHALAAPGEAGEYTLTIKATPPGASSPETWVKRLYVSRPIVVTESTVAAINEAIRTAPVTDNYETVILLPRGYIPMDGNTPILLSRPVTLRGQDTVLASDVVALCPTPGAKLQNLTIRFDEASFYNGTKGRNARIQYHFVKPRDFTYDGLLFAILGNGFITVENCELDGGSRLNQCGYGISVEGNGLVFRGANTIRNFSQAGWILYSSPGPRRYIRGLTLADNRVGVKILERGSTDPYFIRLTDSNFIDNTANIEAGFPVNFSHNFFQGGTDEENITKSPQYMQRLEIDGTGVPAEYSNLRIEDKRLTCAELLNFEGQAPIDTTNFTAADGPVQITVKELDSLGVGAEDSSDVLLQWTFAPLQTADEAPLFRPDAYIDEDFELPAESGIEAYQGVSFAHHGPLPLDGAEIRVQKRVLFQEDTLHLYRLADGALTYLGEIDNTGSEFYTFHLDGCSDYIITDVVVESAGGGDGNGDGGEGNGSSGGGDTGVPGGGGAGGNGGGGTALPTASGSRTIPDVGTAPLADSGQDTAVVADRMPNTPSPGGIREHTRENAEEMVRLGGVPVEDTASDRAGPMTAAYTHIPAPRNQTAAPPAVSANRYVDDTAVRAAFDNPRDGQVVIDVGVRTAVSSLAFRLLAENPTLILVLKGDGYEWRFSGEDVRSDVKRDAFDTWVSWEAPQEGGYARLSFGQQGELPGNCELVLETGDQPRGWAQYSASRSHYMPCAFNARRQGTRLRMELDALGEYVALL